MRKQALIFILLFSSSLLFSDKKSPGQKIKEENLAPNYQNFLKLTKYIMLPIEKEVFMKLTLDRDRDIFIETFWKQRDPTPGTPENEYKNEIINRFNYVNKFFKRGTTREGWVTDMGRIYMILGPPVSIDRFDATGGIYPCQVWYYYGDTSKELPLYFGLVFFQKGGAGEYKLYDPTSDGPASLIMDKKGLDPTNYYDLYEKIRDLAPTLADVSVSIIPGEYSPDFSPSPRNSLIMANILESPKKDVNPSYATHFLDYKTIVSTEYMTNYVESEANVALIKDPILGLNFLHFSMVPKSISIDYYEPKDQYFCNFRLDVSLRVGENIVFQYAKDFPIYFPASDVDRIRGNGVSVEDSFPVAEGKYKLTVLLQNSVGKEFSIFEKDLEVENDSGSPQIMGPLLGYKIENYQSGIHIPYKILDKKLVVDPKNTFSASDDISFLFTVTNTTEDLWKDGEVKVSIRGLREKKPVQKSSILKLNTSNYNRIVSLSQSIPAKELEPDYYELKLSLVDKTGNLIDEKTVNFIVSPEQAISHPIANAKGFSLSNQFLYFYMLARQSDKLNENEKAETYFKKAYELNPNNKEGIVEFANFLLKMKKYDDALGIIENIKDSEKLKYEYFLIKGRTRMGKGEYGEALASLLEGNKIYNSDPKLLNALGFCYYRTGQKQQALEVLSASLRLNPAQEDIKKLIAEIEKMK